MNKILRQIMLLKGLLILLLPNVGQAQLQLLDDEEEFFDAGRIVKAEAKSLKDNFRTEKFLFDFSPNSLLSYWSDYYDACCYQPDAYTNLVCSRFPVITSEVMTSYHLKMYDVQKNSTPPLNGGRIASQVIFGSLGGIVGIHGIALIAINLSSSESKSDAEEPLMPVILCIGSTLGSAMTVYGIGTIGDQTGSFWATLGGIIVGGLIQYSVITATSEMPIQLATFTLQAALATLAFNLTRRWDTDIHSGALIRIKTDKRRVELLSPYLIPVFTSGQKICWQQNLVNIVF